MGFRSHGAGFGEFFDIIDHGYDAPGSYFVPCLGGDESGEESSEDDVKFKVQTSMVIVYRRGVELSVSSLEE